METAKIIKRKVIYKHPGKNDVDGNGKSNFKQMKTRFILKRKVISKQLENADLFSKVVRAEQWRNVKKQKRLKAETAERKTPTANLKAAKNVKRKTKNVKQQTKLGNSSENTKQQVTPKAAVPSSSGSKRPWSASWKQTRFP